MTTTIITLIDPITSIALMRAISLLSEVKDNPMGDNFEDVEAEIFEILDGLDPDGEDMFTGAPAYVEEESFQIKNELLYIREMVRSGAENLYLADL